MLMARRGTKLEQFVKAIQLSIKGNIETFVRTNVKIQDSNGCNREIDVFVENLNQNVAIECKEHHRKLGVKIVDELIGKFVDIPNIHQKAIASIKGFTRDAKLKAAKHNVQLWTLEDISLDMLNTEGSAYYGYPTYIPQNVIFVFKSALKDDVRFIPIAYSVDTDRVCKPDINDIIQNIDNILTSSQKLELVKRYFDNGQKTFCHSCIFTPSKELYCLDTVGNKLIIDHIKCSFNIDFSLEQGNATRLCVWTQNNSKLIEYSYRTTNSQTVVVCNSNTENSFRMDNDVIIPFEMQTTR